GNFTFDKGAPNSDNYNKYRLIRMKESPEVETYFVKNTLSPTGLGEPALPPAGAAIAIAINKATGTRLYKQPFVDQMGKKEMIG
ncbi:MAG: xanthine dehydrogenase family protein molybdopterin-binding subunit, partial [Maribacter sp.]|nr:xanthine dehydrogenase family protein molybdopterin-binding subunit [Maribacter sp.]